MKKKKSGLGPLVEQFIDSQNRNDEKLLEKARRLASDARLKYSDKEKDIINHWDDVVLALEKRDQGMNSGMSLSDARKSVYTTVEEVDPTNESRDIIWKNIQITKIRPILLKLEQNTSGAQGVALEAGRVFCDTIIKTGDANKALESAKSVFRVRSIDDKTRHLSKNLTVEGMEKMLKAVVKTYLKEDSEYDKGLLSSVNNLVNRFISSDLIGENESLSIKPKLGWIAEAALAIDKTVDEVTLTSAAATRITGGPACPHCGQAFPKYPGRYPSKCARCGENIIESEFDTLLKDPRLKELAIRYAKKYAPSNKNEASRIASIIADGAKRSKTIKGKEYDVVVAHVIAYFNKLYFNKSESVRESALQKKSTSSSGLYGDDPVSIRSVRASIAKQGWKIIEKPSGAGTGDEYMLYFHIYGDDKTVAQKVERWARKNEYPAHSHGNAYRVGNTPEKEGAPNQGFISFKKPNYTESTDVYNYDELTEERSLSTRDKQVIRSFLSRKKDESKHLQTDGRQIDISAMGGSRAALWQGGAVHLKNLGSRTGDKLHRAIKKMIKSEGSKINVIEENKGIKHQIGFLAGSIYNVLESTKLSRKYIAKIVRDTGDKEVADGIESGKISYEDSMLLIYMINPNHIDKSKREHYRKLSQNL